MTIKLYFIFNDNTAGGAKYMAALFGRKPKKQYIALDIGSQNTKIVVFETGKALIDTAIIKPTPAAAFQGGAILDKDVLSDFLTQCIAELNLESEISVIAGISGKGVIAKKIDIPQMEESMIPEFVEIEAEQEIFYNKEEMELDYDILKGVNFKKPEAQSLLVVTVLKQMIKNYNNVIDKAFMACDILDTNFAALFNSFEYNQSLNKDKNYMILDIGSVSTNLVVVIKNQVVFARNLPIGGDFFNQEIQKKMNIGYQEAEELKISASKEGEAAPQEVVSLINSELNEAFSEEIFSCYELYRSFFLERDVHQAYITGGGSKTFGLASHLQQKLEFPINKFDPFQRIKLSSNLQEKQEEFKLFLAVATGLALRSLS